MILQHSRSRAALRALTILSIVGVTLSCGGDTTPTVPTANAGTPKPGRLVGSLETPNADDGAIIVSFAGGGIDSVTLATGSSAQLVAVQPSSSTARIILIAGASSAFNQGALVNVWVPDTRSVANYSARIEQVAARVTYVQRTLQGYAMHVTAP